MIEVNNVTKIFDNIKIINDISVKFRKGKIYGFIGRNGSGKTVFLKMICSFYNPTSGEILINGENYNLNGKFPESMRALIENPSFLPDLSGFENLKLLASIQNKISEDEINDSLEQVNLSEHKNKKYKKYSLGMKQKLGIAQVLMENPQILIFDEPFNGIENKTADKIRTHLKEIKKDKIIIIASHIRDDIENLCDDIYEFDDGKIFEYKNRIEFKN